MKEEEQGKIMDSRLFVERSKVKVMNIVTIVSASLAVISAFVGRDSMPYVYSMLALAGLFLVCVTLNNLKPRPRFIEYLLTFGTTAWIIYMCLVFPSSMGEQNYLIIALVALALFSERKLYRSIIIVTLIALTVFLNLFQRFYHPVFAAPAMEDVLFAVNVVTPLTLIALMCLGVLREAARSQATIEAQKVQLEESNAFKDKVFSIIGHDMRAPFNSVRGLIDALDADMFTPEERHTLLEELKLSVDASLQTLDNILRWGSQGYYGSVLHTKTKPEVLNVSAMVGSIVAFFGQTAQQKNVYLLNEVPADTAVLSDREQTSFILRNITSNAIKFSHAGQVIKFSAEQNHTHVTISIADEGVGMTQDVINSLFQISDRVTRDGTVAEKGTGLGLIFCKEFVENNKGRLHISSTPGKGTIVNVELPMAN